MNPDNNELSVIEEGCLERVEAREEMSVNNV